MKKIIFVSMITAMLVTTAGAVDKDRGGGNLYKGRPLESYIQDPRKLPSFQTVDKVLSKLQTVEVKLVFAYALLRKAWYFVPGPLEQLPSDKIGAVIPTEQVALQGFNSVWIDQDLFSRMSLEDQGNLLLHEALMGMRLMRFASMREQCLAVITQAENFDLCDGKNPYRSGKPSDLTAKDYEDIRLTVIDLKNLKPNASYNEIAEFFASRGFSFPFLEFRRKQQYEGATGDEVNRFIIDMGLAGYRPTHLYRFEDFYQQNPEARESFVAKPSKWSPTGLCRLASFKESNGHLIGSYHSQKAGAAAKEYKLDFSFDPALLYLRGLDISNPLDSRQEVYAIGETFLHRQNSNLRSVGDRFIQVGFLLDTDGHLDGIHVEEFVIVKGADEPYPSRIGEQIRSMKNGVNEICSIQSRRIIKP